MLTLEQIAEGRDLEDIACSAFADESDRAARAEWLIKHVDDLLDAAERVAREEFAAQAHRAAVWSGEAPALETDAQLVANELSAGAKLLADAELRKAAARFEELREECARQFHGRPLVEDGQYSANPYAIHPRDIKAWLLSHGLVAGVFIQPNDPSQIVIDPWRVLRSP